MENISTETTQSTPAVEQSTQTTPASESTQETNTVDQFAPYFQNNTSPLASYQPPVQVQPQQQPVVQQQNYAPPVHQLPVYQQPQQVQPQQQQISQQVQDLINLDKEKAFELLDENPVEFANLIAKSVMENVSKNINPQILQQQLEQQLLQKVEAKIQSQEDTRRVNSIVSGVNKGLSEKGVKLNPYQETTLYNYVSQNIDNVYATFINDFNTRMMTGQPIDPVFIKSDGRPIDIDEFCIKASISLGEKLVGQSKAPVNNVINQTLNQIHGQGTIPQTSNSKVDLVSMTDEQRRAYAQSQGWKTL